MQAWRFRTEKIHARQPCFENGAVRAGPESALMIGTRVVVFYGEWRVFGLHLGQDAARHRTERSRQPSISAKARFAFTLEAPGNYEFSWKSCNCSEYVGSFSGGNHIVANVGRPGLAAQQL